MEQQTDDFNEKQTRKMARWLSFRGKIPPNKISECIHLKGNPNGHIKDLSFLTVAIVWHPEVFYEFINGGANINEENIFGRTPLDNANQCFLTSLNTPARDTYRKIIDVLKKNGAKSKVAERQVLAILSGKGR